MVLGNCIIGSKSLCMFKYLKGFERGFLIKASQLENNNYRKMSRIKGHEL